MPLKFLIQFAYGQESALPPALVVGAPGWCDQVLFDVVAKTSAPAGRGSISASLVFHVLMEPRPAGAVIPDHFFSILPNGKAQA